MLLNAFSALFEMIMCYFPCSVYVVYYIDQFSYMEYPCIPGIKPTW